MTNKIKSSTHAYNSRALHFFVEEQYYYYRIRRKIRGQRREEGGL